MKAKIIVLVIATAGFTAAAFLTMPFPGWDILTQKSQDIIIARCSSTPAQLNVKTNGIWIDQDGLIESEIQVVSVLKGATTSNPARLSSQYWPRAGEHYLIFAHYHDGFYQALETYRIIPLGAYFSTNTIAGKPLTQQLQILFKRRIRELSREIQRDEAEKQRLNEGLQK